MSRMRTIQGAAQYLVENDAGSKVSSWTLRTLVKSGQVPSIRVGTRVLVDLDQLELFLQSSSVPREQDNAVGDGRIR